MTCTYKWARTSPDNNFLNLLASEGWRSTGISRPSSDSYPIVLMEREEPLLSVEPVEPVEPVEQDDKLPVTQFWITPSEVFAINNHLKAGKSHWTVRVRLDRPDDYYSVEMISALHYQPGA